MKYFKYVFFTILSFLIININCNASTLFNGEEFNEVFKKESPYKNYVFQNIVFGKYSDYKSQLRTSNYDSTNSIPEFEDGTPVSEYGKIRVFWGRMNSEEVIGTVYILINTNEKIVFNRNSSYMFMETQLKSKIYVDSSVVDTSQIVDASYMFLDFDNDFSSTWGTNTIPELDIS